ncbi:Transposon Ty3-I Gag-Pol polyprotein [Araneus ventricosus]|uniref:Transposon Ty3-I Gag-Pol polyprotein n=1 Tax=Araneus ventricosus TaxID=182803 RepID=A0A4Y2L7W3_ARAVE|nr:Transposon Ty3-I Gag-Pol polyprotein [Araneus ventricosus]
MLNNNIIRPSEPQWSSPLHLINKKDGTLRPCGDYRRLNECTIPDRYPIPRIEDFHSILKDKVIFSKIDLIKSCYQIPITEEDKPKTAIITPFGLYEFNVMSFGLPNVPATFQRFINEVFYGLDFLFPYLDDVLVASTSEEEHKENLKFVFERLDKYGLRINVSKSVLGVDQIEFLGYLITAEGSRPLSAKVQAILDYKLPPHYMIYELS